MRLALAAVFLAACSGGSSLPPVANPGPDQSASQGLPVSFDGSGSTGTITSYQWDFGDGSTDGSGVKVAHTYTSQGTFAVTLTVTGPGGSNSAQAVVNVGPPCQTTALISLLTPSPLAGQSVGLSSAASTGCNGSVITDAYWTFGDGASEDAAASTTVTHTYATAGAYDVELVVTDALGMHGSATLTVNVAPLGGSGSGSSGGASSSSGSASSGGSSSSSAGSTGSGSSSGSAGSSSTSSSGSSGGSSGCSDYSGSWFLTPSTQDMSGCTQFTDEFPATCLVISQSGTSMTIVPSGNTWPSGTILTGQQDATNPSLFRMTTTMPQTTQGTCGSTQPTDAVDIDFGSCTSASGTWKRLYTFGCVVSGGCPTTCNCTEQDDFTAVPFTCG